MNRELSQQDGMKMGSTKDVLENHLRTFFNRDIHGILSDYALDAVMFTHNGTFKGINRISPLFETLFAEFGKGRPTFNMLHQTIEGDYAYIAWTAETIDHVYELATDTFVVRNGKIVAQSFTAKLRSKA